MTARPDRWEKAADRDLARRQRDAGPLFAGFVERKDPEAVRARAEAIVAKHTAAIARGHAESEARGQEARAILAAHVSPEELAAIDRVRAACPPSGEYTADLYCGECRRRGLPWPGKEEYDALWAEVARLKAEEAKREAAKAAAAGEQLALPTGMRIAEYRARVAALTEDEQEAFEEAVAAEDHETVRRMLTREVATP